jgi:lipooligosaccharide transport system permease protein
MSILSSFNISWRFLRVWQRNLIVYRRIWKVNFLPPLLEPIFYLLAFGMGLSSLIGTIDYASMQLSYLQFITPAILAVNIMYNAFFETTYTSFVRMYYQKTFDAMMATPLSLGEVITAEIIWGATKSVIATILMLAVLSGFGLIHYPDGLLIIPLSFLGGVAFGAIGMFLTGITPSIDMFNLPIFLFITPMFLFSGTFFPLANLPEWAQLVALALPLTHLVRITRDLCLGITGAELIPDLIYLLVLSLALFPLAIYAMHRRLIK